MSNILICPKCTTEIEVAEAVASQVRSELQAEFEAASRKRDAEVAAREQEILKQSAELKKKQLELEQQRIVAEAENEQKAAAIAAAQIAKDRKAIELAAVEKARSEVNLQVADLQSQVKEAAERARLAEATELELRKQQRQLEQDKQQWELEQARRLDEERAKIRDAERQALLKEREFADAEKDKTIADLQRKAADLQRTLELGSQQRQGEVLELKLEELLHREFPFDEIMPVPKGEFGGDTLQSVRDVRGGDCGSILWESKRTKTFDSKWLPKLRDDQRKAGAECAVLVTMELPKGVSTLKEIDGVWVTSWECAAGTAAALRSGLVATAAARRGMEGRAEKMDLLYQYLSGTSFQQRVGAILEAYTTLQKELADERKWFNTRWAKREKQLHLAIENLSGMAGDFQGILGGGALALPDFEPDLLPSPDDI